MYRKYSTGGERTTFGGNSLHIAARRGDHKWIHSLFEVVDDVNRQDQHGYTSLHDAVRHGHVEVLQKLIKQSQETGILLDYSSPSTMDGFTPLHTASVGKFLSSHNNEQEINILQEECVRLILQHGGRYLLKLRNFVGQTPEELMPSSLRHLPREIVYHRIVDVVPKFTNIQNDSDSKENVDAEVYCRTLAALIEAYLDTIKFDTFLNLYQSYLQDSEDFVMNLETDGAGHRPDEDLEQHFRYHFVLVFGRKPADHEVDQLIEDVEMLLHVHSMVDQFIYNQINYNQNHDDENDGPMKKNNNQKLSIKQKMKKFNEYFELLLMDINSLISKLSKLNVVKVFQERKKQNQDVDLDCKIVAEELNLKEKMDEN